MPNWMSPDEAMGYFAVTLPELEDLVLDNDLDVVVDDEGNLLQVDAIGAKEIILELHNQRHGYRPDDPVHMERARREHEDKQKKEKAVRRVKKQKLRDKRSKVKS
jgi:hypothetical protein